VKDSDNTHMNLFVAVAVGGAIGACLRYAVALLMGQGNLGFPYATLIANVMGCAAIGVLLFLIDQRELLNAHWRVFLVTGILGSLTTFSTFSYESYSLWMSGERSLAVAAVSANVVFGIAAVACGWTAASKMS
tara:strand:+ start:319 stop:717 length:399 start_codon:yes stop_codon:yes gene_type:complete